MFPISIFARALAGLGLAAVAACSTQAPRPDPVDAPQAFYTVTAELALLRQQPRVAALEYAAAAANERDPGLLRRAADVTRDCLQPSLTWAVATRWIDIEPASIDAHRAAGRAALDLHRIRQAAEQFRFVIGSSPLGADAEFDSLERELANSGNVYGARQLADRLVVYFPGSAPALRLQGFAALRADDPAAAVRGFQAGLALATVLPAEQRRELLQALQRAKILSGERDQPLAEARATLAADGSSAHRLDYAVLLLAAQQRSEARTELERLGRESEAAPAALRLLGLLDFEDGDLQQAAKRFADLLATGKFVDDALYYGAVIAEREGDARRALRLYAQVQSGEDAVQSLMRAAVILRANGAKSEAEALLDQLSEDEAARAPEIMASRIRIYNQAGEMPAAVRLLDHGLLEYPDSVELRYAAASLYEEQGNTSRALRELKLLLKSRPDDPAAQNAYAYTLADHGRQLTRARKLIEQAHAAAPNSAAILDSLGWVLYRQGQSEKALTYLNRAYADDHSADMAAHLGEVLWGLGRQFDARRVWGEGQRTDADNELLKTTRARLHAAN